MPSKELEQIVPSMMARRMFAMAGKVIAHTGTRAKTLAVWWMCYYCLLKQAHQGM
jgi:hypothetical protein